jgi:uncharacterized repeat protein (TIGR03803 family)
MKHRISIFANAVAVLAAFGVVLLGTGPCAIAQEKVLHSFNNDGTDGFYPQSSLFLSDNLLGTTTNGGASNLGTAFRVDPQNGDEAVLGNVFESPTSSGAAPYAGLGFFSPDNTYPAFYSTTSAGGANNLGSIYLMKILGSGEGPGSVIEGVLFSFQGADGSYPYGGLTGPVNGNLYGTTTSGGAYNSGTVFEFTHKSHSFWEEKVLHNFGNGTDGSTPVAGLIMDASGNFYGTTYGGGTYGDGTVFELLPKTGGGWAEQVLYSFNNNGTDGYNPYAGVILDASGNLYGTTVSGGTYNGGVVYELTPPGSGHTAWTETLLHNFNSGSTDDGFNLNGSLIFDTSGNLYGTTVYGGAHGSGTVFELSPPAMGQTAWTETLLYSFANNPDGAFPLGSLIFDASGNLYGMTEQGGAYGYGTVFKIVP